MSSYYYSYLRIVGLLLLILILSFTGCVDTGVQNIPEKINFTSMLNIVNTAKDEGNAVVTFDGQSFGTVAFGYDFPAGSYTQMPAGTRKMIVNFASGKKDTIMQPLPTDSKARIFILKVDAATIYAYLHERYTYEIAGQDGKALVRFFHASPDAGDGKILMSVTGGVQDSVMVSTLVFGKSSPGYFSLTAGSTYNFKLIFGTDTLKVTPVLSAKKRYTHLVYDVKASLKQKLLTDD
ncbi:MAG: hypothetical protein QME52_12790 [Bacteroidota bacterium]|nr:hypothetical protein [Bacteroidota bacterium]